MTENFQGLPIAELISAPLKAACDSQRMLAHSAFEFMTQIGFSEKDKARLLEFNLQRPIEGQAGTSDVTVRAPFLGLVPIPSLLIDDVQIDFQMEVTDTATSKDVEAKEAEVNASANLKFGFFGSGSVSMHGKVSSSRENTRSTNQTAKYQVHVSARQQRPTEGLSKLMDIMAACIEPVPTA
ncbi:MAG: DUF2589 domain-containing protein [Bacteroidales bacterium]|jgi:hypothetical protein|nr:DUF2589 domain-containing protein [Bacteroidales bacterium]